MNSKKRIILVFSTAAMFVALLRWLVPERSLTETGLRAIPDAFFAISLLGIVLIIAAGLGLKLFSWVGGYDFGSSLERLTFATAIGLGALAYGILGLGLIGLLHASSILIGLLFAAALSSREWSALIADFIQLVRKDFPPSISIGSIAVIFLVASILFLSGIQALTPLWDFDGLMYHLQAPKIFLENGRIQLLPDIWQANGPLTMDMLYTIGTAFGSETFAKLLHLAYAAGLVLLTYALGRRYISETGGWVAAGILLGIPIFPLWGSLAYTDMAWAIYEVLALLAIVRWKETENKSWLTLAGICMGLGIGSKYPALGMFAILTLWIAYQSRSRGTKRTISDLIHFAFITAAIGAPWYLKNWLLAGNPIYPFLIGGREWSSLRLDLLMTYLTSFGTGKTISDFLTLPLNLYVQREAFGTFLMSIDMPSILFPLAFLVPFLSKDSRLKTFTFVALLRFGLWALGTQQNRFLLPLYPILSLLAASVLLTLAMRFKSSFGKSLLAYGIVGGVVATTLAYQLIYLAGFNPFPVVFGSESKDTFLRRARHDYAAQRYIAETLEEDARVYQMWDGQVYYCEGRCLADAEQAQWVRLTLENPTVEDQANALNAMQVTHLLLDLEGANFMLNHDPSGLHRKAIDTFFSTFEDQCTRTIQKWPDVTLYALTCLDD